MFEVVQRYITRNINWISVNYTAKVDEKIVAAWPNTVFDYEKFTEWRKNQKVNRWKNCTD